MHNVQYLSYRNKSYIKFEAMASSMSGNVSTFNVVTCINLTSGKWLMNECSSSSARHELCGLERWKWGPYQDNGAMSNIDPYERVNVLWNIMRSVNWIDYRDDKLWSGEEKDRQLWNDVRSIKGSELPLWWQVLSAECSEAILKSHMKHFETRSFR
jgi:hypothetical protein